MPRTVRCVLLAWMTLWAGIAFAQQRPDLTRFKAFADPLVGTWDVTIKDLEADGKVSWEDKQTRVFAYILADEFLEERAIAHSKRSNRDVVAGLHMVSYDPKRNLLLQQGFWPGHAGVLFTVEASLASDNRSAEGVNAMPSELGIRARRRVLLSWETADTFTYRVYGKDERGREFLSEELVYRRRS